MDQRNGQFSAKSLKYRLILWNTNKKALSPAQYLIMLLTKFCILINSRELSRDALLRMLF